MGWENVCLVENLQRLVKLPMVVERNANAPLLAEVWQGAAAGKRNVVYVNYGTGLSLIHILAIPLPSAAVVFPRESRASVISLTPFSW